MTRRVAVVGFAAWLSAGCAQGTADDLVLESGVYELSTLAIEGDCVLEDAITPGGEYVGKVAMVSVDASTGSVRLDACDDFFPDECFPSVRSEPVSMIRDEVALYAEDRQWQVPGCLCFDDWRGTRSVSGTLESDSRAELSWSFELPPPPSGCTCTAVACSATVTQRLVLPVP